MVKRWRVLLIPKYPEEYEEYNCFLGPNQETVFSLDMTYPTPADAHSAGVREVCETGQEYLGYYVVEDVPN